jgi:hypothetical protein
MLETQSVTLCFYCCDGELTNKVETDIYPDMKVGGNRINIRKGVKITMKERRRSFRF